MDTSQLLTTLLMGLGMRVPVLIALGVALVLLHDAPRGRALAVARCGLAALMASVLGQALLSAWPLLLVMQGDLAGVSALGERMGLLRFALEVVQAGGFVALAWALVQGLRRR